jgi:DNA-binding NtrC family response regulator
LLLADIIMPEGITGRDLAEELRQDQPGLKIVLMSGYSAQVVGKDTEFFRRTRSRFVQKPCTPDTLVQTVRQCLDEK